MFINPFKTAKICNETINFSGYMSPEYALRGLFSIKSDVFSFGVLVLETLSSKKNAHFYNTDSLTLLGHVSKKISHNIFRLFLGFLHLLR